MIRYIKYLTCPICQERLLNRSTNLGFGKFKCPVDMVEITVVIDNCSYKAGDNRFLFSYFKAHGVIK